MINRKNIGEELLVFKKSGSAAVANNVDQIVVPVDGYISAIYAAFAQPGVDGTGSPTQDVQVDIKKSANGAAYASIFNGASTSIVWPHANIATNFNNPTVNAPKVNPTAVSKGDSLRIDVLQILNGTSPTQPLDLVVFVVIKKTHGGNNPPSGTRLQSLDILN